MMYIFWVIINPNPKQPFFCKKQKDFFHFLSTRRLVNSSTVFFFAFVQYLSPMGLSSHGKKIRINILVLKDYIHIIVILNILKINKDVTDVSHLPSNNIMNYVFGAILTWVQFNKKITIKRLTQWKMFLFQRFFQVKLVVLFFSQSVRLNEWVTR